MIPECKPVARCPVSLDVRITSAEGAGPWMEPDFWVQSIVEQDKIGDYATAWFLRRKLRYTKNTEQPQKKNLKSSHFLPSSRCFCLTSAQVALEYNE